MYNNYIILKNGELLMVKKYFTLIILFIIINLKIFPLGIYGNENEIIIGRIIFREYYTIDDNILYNRYFVLFDNPWIVEILGIEFRFDEILIANDISEYISEIDYENNIFKIHGNLLLYPINIKESFIGSYFRISIFVENIEIVI